MSPEPHERPEFANAGEYTIKVTVVVAGGARPRTAARRARQVAEKLANAAARTKHVLAVEAAEGPSTRGELHWSYPVGFPAANTAPETADGKLRRWLDADYERALEAAAADRARARERHDRDWRRRRDVGCLDPFQSGGDAGSDCRCVYCRPASHERRLRDLEENGPNPFASNRCICGQLTPRPSMRCVTHRRMPVVLLEGDPPELIRFATAEARLDPDLPPPLEQQLGHDLDRP